MYVRHEDDKEINQIINGGNFGNRAVEEMVAN